jgi:hypothetical protein
MAYSAWALGQQDLRLRSRRVRADRSHGLSVWIALAVFVATTLIGFFGASLGFGN